MLGGEYEIEIFRNSSSSKSLDPVPFEKRESILDPVPAGTGTRRRGPEEVLTKSTSGIGVPPHDAEKGGDRLYTSSSRSPPAVGSKVGSGK